MELETMEDFFTARVDNYDQHMMREIAGADQYYRITAELIPQKESLQLLDLGCGTGLELEEIFPRNPSVSVTGIDLNEAMLEQCRKKFTRYKNQLRLIKADYFNYEPGEEKFDAVLSVQTMHHLTQEEKGTLYRKIFRALKPGGIYIETDYTAQRQEQEKSFLAEFQKLKKEQGKEAGRFHFDIPCTVETQRRLLEEADFTSVELKWKFQNTAIIVGKK